MRSRLASWQSQLSSTIPSLWAGTSCRGDAISPRPRRDPHSLEYSEYLAFAGHFSFSLELTYLEEKNGRPSPDCKCGQFFAVAAVVVIQKR